MNHASKPTFNRLLAVQLPRTASLHAHRVAHFHLSTSHQFRAGCPLKETGAQCICTTYNNW